MTPKYDEKTKKWLIVYRVPGFPNPYTERFHTVEEANFRIAQIELDKIKGTLQPPERRQSVKVETLTLGEYLDEFIEKYGANNWGESYYSAALHRINDYVKPYIGKRPLNEITTKELDEFYASLLTKPAVIQKGHKNKHKTISIDVIEKIRSILGTAFAQAVRWGYITYNPSYGAQIPKTKKHQRDVWNPEEAQQALDVCEDPDLKMCLETAIATSARIGEILGLQWKNIHVTPETIANNTSHIYICQELKRCDKKALKVLDEKGRSDVFFIFPEKKKKNPAKSSLVLKHPKTESSIRTVYLGTTVANDILEYKKQQQFTKKRMGKAYHDFDMFIAQNDGRPVEERFIAKGMKKLCEENNLPVVVFHSLRALSTSIKLRVSGGDIKSVQGDTGHSQATMVTDVYARTFDDNRKQLAEKVDSGFFDRSNPQKDTPLTSDLSSEEIAKLLNESPKLLEVFKAMTILAKAL